MEAIRKHHGYIDYAVNLITGILFIFAVIMAFGYGAAVAIPESILEPLVAFSLTLAFALVDLFTQGIPAVIIFVLLSLAIKLFKVRVVYTILAMPFVLFMLSALPELLANASGSGFHLTSICVKTLPVVICALFLAKQDKVNNGA